MKDQREFVRLVVLVAFILLCIVLRLNNVIGVDFHVLLLLCLIAYLAIFRSFYLIKNAFLVRSDERKTVAIVTVFWLFLIIIHIWREGGFASIFNFSTEILFSTLVEELVFRAVLLGMLIDGIPLQQIKQPKQLPVYFAEGKKDKIKVVASMLVASIIFSDLHLDWILLDPSRLLIRFVSGFVFFCLPFVLTNKKIYTPWLIHYINNVYAFG